MSPEDMASNARKEENAKIREHALWDSERGPAKQATTDQFQCGKCRQRKTTYYVRRVALCLRIAAISRSSC
jgi:transcription elongation factor S-II